MNAKAFLLVLICAATATTSMAMFRSVLHGRLEWSGNLLQFIKDVAGLFLKPMFLLALLVFAGSTSLWLLILATQKLSMAYPLQIGMTLIFTGIVAVCLFSESISTQGYIGYTLLIAGVFLVSR